MSVPKTCIVIAGPTAVGKSDIAVQVAEMYHTGIISADSRQCYRELNIGVARPSEDLLNLVPHHFIANHSIHENITVATFEQEALQNADKLFQTNDVIVLIGGTGLFIKAFCEGLDDVAAPAPELRNSLMQSFEENGIEWLQNEIAKFDPLFVQEGEMQNPRRIMRALEVWHTSGQSIISLHQNKITKRPFEIIQFCLELPRETLYERINKRVDWMMEEGLLEEAKNLYPYKHLNALQTVGYSELFEYFDGGISLPEAISKIKQNTRHYAKRQMTWFKKQQGMNFVKASFPALNQSIKTLTKT